MKDVVWEELGLSHLVEEDEIIQPYHKSIEKKLVKGKDDIIIKHKKMVEKPAFSVNGSLSIVTKSTEKNHKI